MLCDELDAAIEGMADRSYQPTAEEAAHVGSCQRCRTRLARAEAIDQLLASREDAAPSSGFTSAVMARIGDEHWQADRAFDIGFNVAIALGLVAVLAGGAGLAWSLGFVTVAFELDASVLEVGADFAGRAVSQLQTIAMAGVLLTMALALWWWVEMDEGF